MTNLALNKFLYLLLYPLSLVLLIQEQLTVTFVLILPPCPPPMSCPTISLGFLTRVQVDLIDMSSQPDGDYKWILHARDHFSKFSWTFPLTSKRAAEVAEKLTMLFCMFGPPKILQSDNGREFVASVINNITTLWPGLLIIHGSPRRPQTQGCVESGNIYRI